MNKQKVSYSDLEFLVLNLTDLEFLALHSSKWPKCRYIADDFGVDEFTWTDEYIINEPSWDDAPPWAMFKFQNSQGTWFWSDYAPAIKGDYIYPSVRTKLIAKASDGNVPEGHDWRTTLQKRPEHLWEKPKKWSPADIAALISAIAEGKELQVYCKYEDVWYDADYTEVCAMVQDKSPDEYRVSPVL